MIQPARNAQKDIINSQLPANFARQSAAFSALFGESGISLSDILALSGGEHLTATLHRGESILEVILSCGGHGAERTVIAVVHDITQEQHLEEARRKNSGE